MRRRTRTLQRAALVLPVACVVVLALSWWSSRDVEPRPAARLYGMLNAHGLAVRAQSFWVTPNALEAFEQDVLLELEYASGRVQHVPSRRAGNTSEFNAAFSVDRPRALRLWSIERSSSPTPLAAVKDVAFPQTPLPPVRRGGWATGINRGPLSVEVGVVRGVLAVPFPSEILVRLRRGDDSVIAQKLQLDSTGADVGGSERRSVSLVTDRNGEARVVIVPREHVVELTVRVPVDTGVAHGAAPSATPSDAMNLGTWFGTLPVVPGASWVERIADELRVHSPVARSAAYVHLARPTGESWLTTVPLRFDGVGSSGAVRLPEAFAAGGGFFAVASSEPDTQSMALVGWPVGHSEPTASFDLRLPLIADGVPAVREQLARSRARRASWALWSCAAAALLEAVLLLAVMRTPRAPAPGVEPTPASVTSWIALICIAAAVLGLGLLGMFTS